MFEGTKRRSAPFWIPPLDILKLLGLFLCLGLSLFRACSGPVAAPLTIDAPVKQLALGTRGEVVGSAAPGSTVSIYQGNKFLGDTVARADGTWNYALPALVVGSYAISARSANASVVVPVNVDVIEVTKAVVADAPTAIQEKPLPASAPVILSPVGGAVLPQSQLGNAEGTANAGNKVTLFDGDVKIGETTTGPNGRWSLALPALAVGAHRITAKALGGDGAEVASYPIQLNVTAPVAPPAPTATTAAPVATATTAAAAAPAATATTAVAAPAATATTAAAAAQPAAPVIAEPAAGAELPAAQLGDVSGTGTAGNKITVQASDKPIGETTVGADGKWSLELPKLDVGSYKITAREADASGKEVASNTTEIKVVEAPVVVPAALANEPPAIASPADGAKLPVAKLTSVSGEAAADSKVEVSVDGKPVGKADADSAGKWSLDVTGLLPGAHTLSAKDANGASEEAKITVYGSPVITFPAAKKVQPGETVLKGTAPPDSRVIVIFDGDKEVGRVTADAKGNWEFQIPAEFAVGKHTVKVRAEDTSGVPLGESDLKELEVILILPTTGEDLSGN